MSDTGVCKHFQQNPGDCRQRLPFGYRQGEEEEYSAIVNLLLQILHIVVVQLFSPVQCVQFHGLQPTRLFCPQDFPGKNARVRCHFLLQGIFPTQGLNPGLLHCRWILCSLSQQGSLATSKISWDSSVLTAVVRCSGRLISTRHSLEKVALFLAWLVWEVKLLDLKLPRHWHSEP